MKNAKLLIVLAVLIIPQAVCAQGNSAFAKTVNTTVSSPGVPLLTDGFESGNLNNWARQSIDGNGSITLVTQPVASGGHAVKFSVPDDGKSYRAELATNPTDWGTYRYQFSVYLPSPWQSSPLASIVAQWHGTKLSNGKDTNPPISLAVQDNHWRLIINHLATPTNVQKKVIALPDIQTDTWNQFDIRIAWSRPGQMGTVTLYHNGQLWARYNGENNYNQKNPPYFKIGIYHPDWNPAKGKDYPVGGAPVVVYHDDVTVTKYSGPM